MRAGGGSPQCSWCWLRPASQVADAFGVSPVTVWRWDEALSSAGVAGLIPDRNCPRPRRRG